MVRGSSVSPRASATRSRTRSSSSSARPQHARQEIFGGRRCASPPAGPRSRARRRAGPAGRGRCLRVRARRGRRASTAHGYARPRCGWPARRREAAGWPPGRGARRAAAAQFRATTHSVLEGARPAPPPSSGQGRSAAGRASSRGRRPDRCARAPSRLRSRAARRLCSGTYCGWSMILRYMSTM